MRARVPLIILFLLQLQTSLAQPVEKLLLSTTKQWYYPGESVWFVINTLDACRNRLAQLSGVVYVELVDIDAQPVYRSKLIIENAQGKGSIPVTDNVTSGTYTLIAYTSWMKNFGTQVFVRKTIYIVNPARPAKFYVSHSLTEDEPKTLSTIVLQTSKKEFTKRERVAVKCSIGNPARFSVSVYRVDELEKETRSICMSNISDPCNAVISRPVPFAFERRGHIVSGRVINQQTQLRGAGVRGYLSVIDYPDQLFVSTSDSSGNIQFDIGELTGETEFVLQADAAGHGNFVIELNDPFADSAASFSRKADEDVFESSAPVIDEAIVSAQVQKIFSVTDSIPSSVPVDNTKPFYGKPDGFYLMRNYKHFNTVEEILREYVTNVGVQKRHGKLRPVVFDLKTLKRFSHPPLMLVNGVPVLEADRFMRMNTDDFYSIAVVAGRYFIGNHIFYGIIDVRLNNSVHQFGANARVVDYNCLEPRRIFISPDYSNESSRLNRKPDFRSVLYWNPFIETDNTGNATLEFYTSDLEGEYVVVVNAIARNGQISMGNSLITVK